MNIQSAVIKGADILKSRSIQTAQLDAERSQDRKSKIGTGDRSERIRTYNFPQGRVTDHRINLTLQAQEDSLSNLK